jgi:hypothetical protein
MEQHPQLVAPRARRRCAGVGGAPTQSTPDEDGARLPPRSKSSTARRGQGELWHLGKAPSSHLAPAPSPRRPVAARPIKTPPRARPRPPPHAKLTLVFLRSNNNSSPGPPPCPRLPSQLPLHPPSPSLSLSKRRAREAPIFTTPSFGPATHTRSPGRVGRRRGTTTHHHGRGGWRAGAAGPGLRRARHDAEDLLARAGGARLRQHPRVVRRLGF